MPPPKASATSVAGFNGVEKNPRKTAKSRNGCQICKIKRLKCDETRPACENCTRRGYDCPGYNKVLKWSTKYEVLQSDEPETQVFHPSIEHQFSAIDPSSFGHAGPSSGGTPAQDGEFTDGNAGPLDLLSQAIGSAMPDSVPSGPFVPGLEAQGPYCAWNEPFTTHSTQSQQSVVPFHGAGLPADQRGTADENREDDEVQVIPRKRTKRVAKSEQIAQWKSLLRSYYRINSIPITRSYQNDSTALVEHYFRDVCALFSAFDSKLNPFRTVIARLWDNSSSIFYAIQSMAAAHLANYMPGMAVTGLQMQRKAYESLQTELQLAHINQTMDDKLLLTVLLLGLSCAWHDPTDLGMAHLSAARALITPRLLRDDGVQSEELARNDQFFAEALIYWEMCLAFVSHEPLKQGQERPLKNPIFEDVRSTSGAKLVPHPWTGVAPRVQMIFAEVGRLVRNHCALEFPLSYGETPEESNSAQIIAAAMDFEEELLSIHLPSVDDMVDVQDERTGKSDFIMIAEATRCSALLEIYRVFPAILSRRLEKDADASSPTSSSSSGSISFLFFDQPSHPKGDGHSTWLTSLARHITMDLIGAVPSSSGTRPLQMILLVTAASELRLVGPNVSSPGLSDTTSYDLDIARARGFAMTRLHELASRLPSKPVFQVINLVREVWRRNDVGENVFWLDIMHQNGWQTIMG